MIFISYSKDDAKWKDEVLAFLTANENIYNKKVTFYDADIDAGEDFQKKIEYNVASAKAAILLVSNNYLKSPYIKTNELEPFLRRKNVKIYWFLLSSCNWEATQLSILQCANVKEAERIVTFNELKESNRGEEINKILNQKCKQVYEYVTKKSIIKIETPKEFVYKCNRNIEAQFFKIIYTDCYTEKNLLAYSILGDKDDSLNNLHDAIKLKVLINDYKDYDIKDIKISSIEVNTVFSKEQNLLLFKSNFLKELGIAYDVSKLKSYTIGYVYEQLKKKSLKQTPKNVLFISIKVESTAFYEDTFLEILRWLNDPIIQRKESRYSLKLFLLFIFEKSSEDEDANLKMIDFLINYCKNTDVEKIIKEGRSIIDLHEDCLDLIFLGKHRQADKKALNDWYEKDYRSWFYINNIPLSDENYSEFEDLKNQIFRQDSQVKMRIVEKTLQTFLNF